MRKQHDQIDIVEAGEGIDRGTAGIARGRDHDGGALRALGQHMVHQPRDQLHRDVLERQRRPVKQLQQELIGTGLVERNHGGMAERGVGLIGHAAEIGVGDFAADERADHLDRDFPIGPAEQAGDGFGRQVAARFRARRGRRRGRARSASHRRNLAWGPPPASKYTASNRPPKASGYRQAFDIDELSNLAGGEVARHHKAFWGEGEMPKGLKITAIQRLSVAAATASDKRPRSRGGIRPSFAGNFPRPLVRGRGDAGRPMRPIAACATVVGRTHTR